MAHLEYNYHLIYSNTDDDIRNVYNMFYNI